MPRNAKQDEVNEDRKEAGLDELDLELEDVDQATEDERVALERQYDQLVAAKEVAKQNGKPYGAIKAKLSEVRTKLRVRFEVYRN